MTEFTLMLSFLILIPAVLVVSLALLPHWGTIHLAIHAIAVATYFLFVFVWGKYTLMGSYYFRFLLPATFLTALVIAWRRRHRASERHGLVVRILYVAILIGSIALMYYAVPQARDALRGVRYPANQEFVDLAFPLRDGHYYVSDGGTNRLMNVHYRPNTPAQKFAIDIVKLDTLGALGRHFSSEVSSDANIFGERVYAPCSGVVTEAADGVADHKVGDYDEQHPLGNHVVLQCNGLLIEMAHFKNGSVKVRTNDIVKAGDPLAAVGNSGFSEEPHLHVQATKTPQGQPVSSGQGIPMKFSGRFLTRNDVVVN